MLVRRIGHKSLPSTICGGEGAYSSPFTEELSSSGEFGHWGQHQRVAAAVRPSRW